MKRFVLSFLVIALTFGAAQAQQPQRKSKAKSGSYSMQQAEAMKNRLYNDLQLTASQRSQADVIANNLKNDFVAIRSNNALSQAEKKSRIMAAAQQHQASFRSILTAEQASRFDQMVNEARAKHGKKMSATQPSLQGNTFAGNAFGGNSGDLLSGLLGNGNILGALLGSTDLLGSLLSGNFSLANILGSNFNLGSIISIFSGR